MQRDQPLRVIVERVPVNPIPIIIVSMSLLNVVGVVSSNLEFGLLAGVSDVDADHFVLNDVLSLQSPDERGRTSFDLRSQSQNSIQSVNSHLVSYCEELQLLSAILVWSNAHVVHISVTPQGNCSVLPSS